MSKLVKLVSFTTVIFAEDENYEFWDAYIYHLGGYLPKALAEEIGRRKLANDGVTMEMKLVSYETSFEIYSMDVIKFMELAEREQII